MTNNDETLRLPPIIPCLFSERVETNAEEAAGFTDQWRQNQLGGGARYKLHADGILFLDTIAK